jgi:hypothetical protein
MRHFGRFNFAKCIRNLQKRGKDINLRIDSNGIYFLNKNTEIKFSLERYGTWKDCRRKAFEWLNEEYPAMMVHYNVLEIRYRRR